MLHPLMLELLPIWGVNGITPFGYCILAGFLFIAYLALYIYAKTSKRPSKNHRFKINQSKRVLDKIKTFSSWQAQFSYVRKIHFNTFEELILTAIERRGGKVFRNSSYSGDGGIDGKAIIDGVTILIQAKRYQKAKYVSNLDIQNFHDLCVRKRVMGLFIHTAKTPKAAQALHDKQILILTGEELIEFLVTDVKFSDL